MPHTDTNISRDALRSYGMQPARRLNGERGNKDQERGGTIRIYSDGEADGFEINPAKVYVDVLAEIGADRRGVEHHERGCSDKEKHEADTDYRRQIGACEAPSNYFVLLTGHNSGRI